MKPAMLCQPWPLQINSSIRAIHRIIRLLYSYKLTPNDKDLGESFGPGPTSLIQTPF
jgi:hypothetical protein